ncbi:MAG TPA: lipopolysaccharide kinase InaA family protein [Chthoniobacterales bacterium]|nr:lipopolysaccharide kinase InaA family protein [Chthoniobacterales bacterium]
MTRERARKLQDEWRRRVRRLPLGDGTWCYSRALQRDDPRQGWKIHVAATPLSANEVLTRVQSILTKGNLLFKVPARLEFLAQLNSGLRGFSQIGKFLTVYARSPEEATDLAERLHAASRDLRGPQIPFDARYRKNSLVYYRYGSFRASGNNAGTIVDPRGRPHSDKRAPNCAVPRWTNDPFRQSRAHPNDDGPALGPLAPDYLVYKVISQRGKGGVYEAMDLSVSPARVVIVKEGRPHGETAWDGEDGFARVKQEGTVLRALHAAGIPVPQVFREFNRERNRYLVVEKIGARPLLPRNHAQPLRVSWRRAERLLEQLSPILAKIHRAGWVWRDCKPSHIFRQRDRIWLIDFEGAVRVNRTGVLPWGSREYFPPIYRRRFCRHRGIREDDYALGVIAFQFGTGRFPSESKRGRQSVYRKTRCPLIFQDKLEKLLASSTRRGAV